MNALHQKTLRWALSLVALAPALTLAAPIPIANHSFEEVGLPAGAFTNDISPWNHNPAPNTTMAFVEHITGFAADGTHHLGVAFNHNVFQFPGHIVQPNTRYTLRVAIGNRTGQTVAGNNSTYALSAGGAFPVNEQHDVTLLTGADTFVDGPPGSFNSQEWPQTVGNPLVIQFAAYGVARSHFDNIRLDITSVLVTNANDSGPGSLRQAIIDANEGDTVLFHDGIFNGGPEDVITLSSQISLPNKTLTIDASTLCAGVTISGGGSTRILFNSLGGTMTFQGVNFVDAFTSASGGGMVNIDGEVTFLSCTFDSCISADGGGAIFNDDTVTLINCTLCNNAANLGGAIINDPGGNNPSASLTIINSTITNNTGTLCCGGVVARAMVSLENCIIAQNSMHDISAESANITATNCLIGMNTTAAALFPAGTPNVNGDYVGTAASPLDPNLNPLGRYGGPTPVRLPLPGSDAINNGSGTGNTPNTDQRGAARPIGGLEIGAVEIDWGSELAGSAPIGFGTFFDITHPLDSISAFTASSPPSPPGEAVEASIDNNINTKYLNFSRLNTGLDVTPIVGATQLVGLTLTSANDAPGRDPATFVLLGLKASGATSIVATGEVPAFTTRFEKQEFFFAQASESYASYRLIFPTVASALPSVLNDSMQIAEVELLGAPVDRSLRLVKSKIGPSGDGVNRLVEMICITDPGEIYALEFSDDLDTWIRWITDLSPTPESFVTVFGLLEGLDVPSHYHRVAEDAP